MEESKVFKNIWRFNAIIIAIAGVLSVTVLIFSIYMIYKESNRDRHRNEIVNIDQKTKIQESFRLGSIEHVKGSQAVIVPLYSEQKFSHKYSGSKSTTSTRNLLFSNMHNEINKWLLPSNDFLIVSHKLINETNSYDSNKNIITILYQIVKSDSNNDSRLTENDQLTIAISEPDGKKYTEVIKDVDELLGYDVLSKQDLAIMFSREHQGYIAYIDLTDIRITKEIKLPKIN